MSTPTERAGARGIAADQQAWPEPTAPGGRRLPAAKRERKPVLAVLAVLLIALGAVGAYYLVTKNAQRVTVIEVIKPLQQGEKIPLSSLRAVQIPSDTDVSYVRASEAAQVTNFYAAENIPAGTLFSSAMATQKNPATIGGKYLTDLSLKDGQLPPSLQPGQKINLVRIGNGTVTCSKTETAGTVVSSNVLVVSVARPNAGSSDTNYEVVVAVPASAANSVTCEAANSNIAVTIAPASSGTG